MAEVSISSRCAKPDCQFSITGNCIEGHVPAESCPFYGNLESIDLDDFDEDTVPETTDTTQSSETNRIKLEAGEPLTTENVDKFLLSKPIKFVTIIGDRESGKTTLICAIYDLFLRNKTTDFTFSGSKTLIGFEKRSHFSRADSGRDAPDTIRTSLSDGLKFFHLSLTSKADPKVKVELMMSDRAGEQYLNARNNSGLINDLIEVKKGHHIVILMDGARLADPLKRNNAMQAVRQTVRSFTDNKAITNTSNIQIVITKIDLLENIPNKIDFESKLHGFQEALRRDFEASLGSLSFVQISARDPRGSNPADLEVGRLLSSWCQPIPIIVTHTKHDFPLRTEFDRLLSRTPIEENI